MNFQLTKKEIRGMINSWSLLYEELNGTMDETYPMKEDKELEEIKLSGGFEWTPGSPWPPYVGTGNTAMIDNKITPQESDEYDIPHSDSYYDYTRNDPDRKNPFTDPKDRERAFKVTGNWEERTPWIYESPDGGKTVYRHVRGRDPLTRERVILQDETYPTVSSNKPKPDLKGPSHHKYQEDKGIDDLRDYVTSTYTGHYTNKNSDTQTLDLIHSVGDAESFCRSNALKYLSRYDKKGSAKQDILKAMHYCLLLYYFSGNTQEPEYTNARYETF